MAKARVHKTKPARSESNEMEKSKPAAYEYNLVSITPLAAALVAVLVYCNSLLGEFVLDDREAIVSNKDVLGQSPLAEVFLNDYWGTELKNNESHKSYRPLTVLSFRANHAIHGLEVTGFHAANVGLHAIVSALYTHVCLDVLGPPSAGATAGLLFATTPIHTEAVASVVGRAELLCALFYLSALGAYKRSITSSSRSRFAWLFGTMLLSAAAMLAKEAGITALALAAAYDLLLHQRVLCKLPWQPRSPAALPDSVDSSVGIRMASLLAAAATLLLCRLHLMGSLPTIFKWEDNPASFAPDASTRGLTYAYLGARHMWLLVSPLKLCADWSGHSIALITSLTDPRNAATLALVAAGLQLTWLCLLRPRQEGIARTRSEKAHSAAPLPAACEQVHTNREGLIALSAAATLIPFLPASHMLIRVGFVLAERVLYLPSMGFCAMVALGIEELHGRLGHIHQPLARRARAALVGALLLSYSAKTLQRNRAWGSSLALYEEGVLVNPGNAKLQYNLGLALQENEAAPALAEQHYREALRIRSDYTAAMSNLAVMLEGSGRLHEAEELHRRAVKLDPSAGTWDNLGTVLQKQGRLEEAHPCYESALSLDPRHAKTYSNYGQLHQTLGRLDLAEAYLRRAVEENPAQASAHSNLGNLLQAAGRIAEAQQAYEVDHTLTPISPSGENLLHGKRCQEAHRSLRRASVAPPHASILECNSSCCARRSKGSI
ncbi:hypothetical protein CYMTET_28561 [Cymbomonas tetramitiformis]|uniref:dolichyl-phosphate-mannose--protein mannosyltransferase n=1 Tax=Cymbomonas tetramitiformis TaxID=36881 RepID=A0AAE0FMP5_9CHLO|nr:hypothetical protein CYMTET_28561 [Cymbomonas tetramitiformis]